MKAISYLLKKISLSLLLIFIVVVAFGQMRDTIEVSKDLAAILMFENIINTPIYGNNPKVKIGDGVGYKYYDVFVKDNVLITSAKSSDVPFTTLTVIFENGEVFKGYIRYNKYVEKNYYDYTGEKSGGESVSKQQKQKAREIAKNSEVLKKGGNEEKNEAEVGKMNERLKKMLDMKVEIKSVGRVIGKMMFQVGNLRNDKRYSYIKLDVQNGSSTVYRIDGIMLRYIEMEGFLRNKEKSKKRIFPEKVIYTSGETIGAKSKENVVFAIESFGTEKGKLVIKVVEKDGDRDINIEIPIRKINSAKTF